MRWCRDDCRLGAGRSCYFFLHIVPLWDDIDSSSGEVARSDINSLRIRGGAAVTLLEVLVIALIQGLGEVLPLGASGLLASQTILTGAPESRAALSVAAHMGVILALMLYFWRDVAAMSVGVWRLAKGKPDGGSRLFLFVAAGTIPAALAGWFLLDRMVGAVSPVSAASFVLVGGLFLLVSDKLGVTVRRIEHMGFAGAVGLGALQILARAHAVH